MSLVRHAIALLPGLLLPLLSLADDGGRARPHDTAFEEAMAHYAHCDWERAFEAFAQLADAGHPEAARIALLMRAHGPRLFGHTFVAGLEQRQRWVDAAMPTRPGD